MKKWHFNIRNVHNVPKTHFWVLLLAFWAQNTIFMCPKNLIKIYYMRPAFTKLFSIFYFTTPWLARALRSLTMGCR